MSPKMVFQCPNVTMAHTHKHTHTHNAQRLGKGREAWRRGSTRRRREENGREEKYRHYYVDVRFNVHVAIGRNQQYCI